jgi:hypothetical protein
MSQIHENTMKFTDVYEAHRMLTGKLDSLSIHLTERKITTAEAQQQYTAIKQALQVATEKLPTPTAVSQTLKASRTKFSPMQTKKRQVIKTVALFAKARSWLSSMSGISRSVSLLLSVQNRT